MAQIIKLNDIGDIILAKLYEHLTEDDAADSALNYDLYACFSGKVGRKLVDRAIDELEKAESVKVDRLVNEETDGYFIYLTNKGIKVLERKVDNDSGMIGKYFNEENIEEWFGEAIFSSAESGAYNSGSEIWAPASDRMVNLNHNQSDYRDAVSELENVIETFRNDHRLDNEFGHEKKALLKALEGGRELLNDSIINLRVSVALIVEPLNRLIDKYKDALVGVLAAKALDLFTKLIGIEN